MSFPRAGRLTPPFFALGQPRRLMFKPSRKYPTSSMCPGRRRDESTIAVSAQSHQRRCDFRPRNSQPNPLKTSLIPEQGCPPFVRKLEPNQPNSGNRSVLYLVTVYGTSRLTLSPSWTVIGLITQRSLVRIQPPLSSRKRNSRYRFMAAPGFSLSTAPRSEMTARP